MVNNLEGQLEKLETNNSNYSIGDINLANMSYGNGTNNEVRLVFPNVNNKNAPQLNNVKLDHLILKYSLLISMKRRLEDKLRDTKEVMDYIEPYRCVSEFIGSQYVDVLNGNIKEKYDTTLGCMSDIYSMKHMFKEKNAIIRFASGVTKTMPVDASKQAKTFLGQIMYLSGGHKSVNAIAREWTEKFGSGKEDHGAQYEGIRARGEQARTANQGRAFGEDGFDIREKFLGWSRQTFKRRGVSQTEFKAPPLKLKNGEDNPDGIASKLLSGAYYKGFCFDASLLGGEKTKYAASNDEHALANADRTLWPNFWDERLRLFAKALGVVANENLYDSFRYEDIGNLKKYQDEKIRCTTSNCENYCKSNSLEYYGGMESLVTRMLKYKIPKVKTSQIGFEGNFNKIIVNMSKEAKRIQYLLKTQNENQKRKKGNADAPQIREDINTLKTKLKDLKRKQGTFSGFLPTRMSEIKNTQAQLTNKLKTLNKMKRKEEAAKDMSQQYIEKQIKQRLNSPLLTWEEMSLPDREKVIKESDIRDNLKSNAHTLLKSAVGTILEIQHKGKADRAVVVPLPGNRKEIISHNALKNILSKSILSHLPQEFSDMIHQADALIKARDGGKQILLDDAFGVTIKRKIQESTSSFLEILKDLNSSHTVVSDRLLRRKNRKSEEFTKKMKSSSFSFIRGDTNKSNQNLLEHMYKDMGLKMEATREFMKKRKKMPEGACDYFEILSNHFLGRGTATDCNSNNIKRIFKIYKTSKNIQNELSNMFDSDRKLREAYQYATDDYVNDGKLDISSCASDFMTLGNRQVSINPQIIDKIRDKKIQKEIRKYNILMDNIVKDRVYAEKDVEKKKMQLEKETNRDTKTKLNTEIGKGSSIIKGHEDKLIELSRKLNILIRMKKNAQKGKIIASDKKNKSYKGNNILFKQATLLSNYIGYLLSTTSGS